METATAAAVNENAMMRSVRNVIAAMDQTPDGGVSDNNNNNNNNNNSEQTYVQYNAPSPTTTTARPPLGYKTFSEAYRGGEEQVIQSVLQTIEEQANKRVKEGFNELNFTIGVLNCIFIAYVLGAYPQHFWLLYLIEAIYFIPTKFYYLLKAKPWNQALYFLDFCWCMNILGTVILILLIVAKDYLSEVAREHIFLGSFGIACGPLLGATGGLPFVALIFHDVQTMTGVFIHILPPLLFYTLRWNAEEIVQAWPRIFYLDYDIHFFPSSSSSNGGTRFLDSVFGVSIVGYFIWFVPYLLWIYFVGLDLPRVNRSTESIDGTPPAPVVYDTVFHSNMRRGLCVVLGSKLWNRSVEESKRQVEMNDFEVRDLIVYMCCHFLAVFLTFPLLAYPCNLSKYAHGSMLVLMMVIIVHRGAQRYTYYSTEMYHRAIRKQYPTLHQNSKSKQAM